MPRPDPRAFRGGPVWEAKAILRGKKAEQGWGPKRL